MAAKPDAKAAGPEPRLLQALLQLAEFNPKMRAFECCEKLGGAKAAYLALYPETRSGVSGGNARQGKKAVTPSFVAFIASKGWGCERSVRLYVNAFENLTQESRDRLRLNDHGAKMTHLRNLSRLSPRAQARAFDLLDTGRAATLAEAVRGAGDDG